jgi:hypothetical protein
MEIKNGFKILCIPVQVGMSLLVAAAEVYAGEGADVVW